MSKGFFQRWFGPAGGETPVSGPVSISPKMAAPKVLDSDGILQKLLETTSIDGCIQVYTNAPGGSVVEQRAMDKVKKIARTFYDWLMIYQSVSPASALGIFASEQLFLTACTFEDWEKLSSIDSQENQRTTSLEKMAALAHSWEEQVKVYELASEGSALKAMMLNALKSQVKDVNDWASILESANNREIKNLAGNTLIALTPNNLGALCDLLSCHEITHNSSLEEIVLDRIRKLKLTFTEWIEVVNDRDQPLDVRSIAIEMVTNDPEMASKGFEGWKKILDAADEDSDLEKRAATIVVASAPTDDPDVLIELFQYSVISNDSDLEQSVLAKLQAVTSAAFEKWKSIYESADDNDVKKVALGKMIDGVDSVDKLIAVDEAVDDDDQDADFEKLFGPKAKVILSTKETCRRVVENYFAEGLMFATAFGWLLDQAGDTRGCFDLCVSLLDDWKTEDDEVNDELFDKAVSKLLSVASQGEIYIMSKLGDEFGSLSSEARGRLVK